MKKALTFILVLLCGVFACSRLTKHSSATLSSTFNPGQVPSSVFSIDGQKDTVVTGLHGTKLMIRGNSFVNRSGQAVTGKVEVELKEALSMEDIVLGNLTTLTDGKALQSGGMVYVNASSNNENIFIAKNNSIRVAVPTISKDDSMQLYTGIADRKTGQLNWVNPQSFQANNSNLQSDTIATVYSDSIPPVKQVAIPGSLKAMAKAAIPVAPILPQKIESKGDTILSLVFDTADYPELAAYRNVKFKLVGSNNFDAGDSKHEWITVDLTKNTNEQGIYTIHFGGFENGKEVSKSYTVSPAFSPGEDYNRALAVYNKRFSDYEFKKNKIEEARLEKARLEKLAFEKQEREEKLAQAKWEEEQRIENEKAQNESKRLATNLINKSGSGSIANPYTANAGVNGFYQDPAATYVFEVSKFGWSNIDRLCSSPNLQKVNLVTEVQNQGDFDEVHVSVAFTNENVYLPGYLKNDRTYGFSHSDQEQMQLPVGSPATILAVAYKDGQLFSSFQKITIKPEQNVSLKLEAIQLDQLKSKLKTSL